MGSPLLPSNLEKYDEKDLASKDKKWFSTNFNAKI